MVSAHSAAESDVRNLQAGGLGFGPALAAGPQADFDLDAAIMQVQRVGVPLRTESNHGHFLALDQGWVRICVIVNICHSCDLSSSFNRLFGITLTIFPKILGWVAGSCPPHTRFWSIYSDWRMNDRRNRCAWGRTPSRTPISPQIPDIG